SAQLRRLRERGVEHAGQVDVDSVLRAAVDFARRIEALRRFADDAKILAILQLDTSGLRQLRRVFDDLAERHAPVAGHDEAVFDAAIPRVRLEPLRSDVDEPQARLGAGRAELFPSVAYAGTAAGDLSAEQVVHVLLSRWCELDV